MELFQEILCHVFANENVQVTFPGLTLTDTAQIGELECYQALRRIKTILEDDTLEDSDCFRQIEEIVCVFENLGSDGGCRHDFG